MVDATNRSNRLVVRTRIGHSPVRIGAHDDSVHSASHHAERHHEHSAFHIVFAIALVLDRGSTARLVTGLAELTGDDRVVDVGCGPGAAVRMAARRCATATGVDPSPVMVRLGRWINAARGARNVSLVEGSAEHNPLPDGSASVIWALRSVHHWSDRGGGTRAKRTASSRHVVDCFSSSSSSNPAPMAG